MSRHRVVRNMDYSDEYDGYDDVYGHSIDDDYYISPSNRQFLYNRESSTKSSEDGIKEEDEVEAELTDVEKSKLESCIDDIKNVLGSINIPRNILVDLILHYKYDTEKTVNAILEDPKLRQGEALDKKEKDDRVQHDKFLVPKLNGLKDVNMSQKFKIPKLFDSDNNSKKEFTVPNIFNKNQCETSSTKEFAVPNIFGKNVDNGNPPNQKNFIIPKLASINVKTALNTPNVNSVASDESNSGKYSSLSELVSNHLHNSSNKSDFSKNNSKDAKIEVDMKKTVNKLENLQLADRKSLSSSEIKSPMSGDWHIDLSVALKSVNSLPSFPNDRERSKLEKFDIPFVDCENQITLPKDKQLLPCNFDVSNVLLITSKYEKSQSKVAEVLCLDLKRHGPVLKRLNDDVCLSKIKRFRFNSPSPDDIISSHLRR